MTDLDKRWRLCSKISTLHHEGKTLPNHAPYRYYDLACQNGEWQSKAKPFEMAKTTFRHLAQQLRTIIGGARKVMPAIKHVADTQLIDRNWEQAA